MCYNGLQPTMEHLSEIRMFRCWCTTTAQSSWTQEIRDKSELLGTSTAKTKDQIKITKKKI